MNPAHERTSFAKATPKKQILTLDWHSFIFVCILAGLCSGCSSVKPAGDSTFLVGIKRLDHYAVHVADLERSASFYKRVFDFGIVNKWKTTWMVGNDFIRVGLFLRPQAIPVLDSDNKIIIEHVAFLTDERRFAQCLARLDSMNIPHEPPEDTGIAKSVFFKDPDGHLLEITYYYKHAPRPLIFHPS